MLSQPLGSLQVWHAVLWKRCFWLWFSFVWRRFCPASYSGNCVIFSIPRHLLLAEAVETFRLYICRVSYMGYLHVRQVCIRAVRWESWTLNGRYHVDYGQCISRNRGQHIVAGREDGRDGPRACWRNRRPGFLTQPTSHLMAISQSEPGWFRRGQSEEVFMQQAAPSRLSTRHDLTKGQGGGHGKGN